ncbi:MAG TPA: MgtC/SapB family protein [Candidatus Angelobacter sp.]|nr:MgtC/SapB family protein [Candidatus Angelobacter sp.]
MSLEVAWPHISHTQVLSQELGKLLLAAVLGGIVGIERELKHRAAGLRTNMFICFGAAMFTVISVQLATAAGGDHTRIASQIIPGIGFIGAGSILHAQRTISGLTTAATIFVVASIGMASGGGLYGLAVFATVLLLLCLQVLGALERRYNLKSSLMHYSILTDRAAEEITEEIDSVLEDHGKAMQDMKLIRFNGKKKIIFTLDGTRSQHEEIMASLRQSKDLSSFTAVRGPETD